MNGTIPNAKNWPEQKRRRSLRAIDKGTNYDVSGKLRKIVHEIESGKYGEVTDVVIAIRSIKSGIPGVRTAFLGKSQPEVLHYMACRLAKEIL